MTGDRVIIVTTDNPRLQTATLAGMMLRYDPANRPVNLRAGKLERTLTPIGDLATEAQIDYSPHHLVPTECRTLGQKRQ